MHSRTAPSGGRRRLIVSVVGAIAVAVLAVGCSNTDPAVSSSNSPTSASAEYMAPASDLTANITYAFWDMLQKPAIEANIAGFNKLYPNIKVNLDVTPWEVYWTKIQTQASSDTLPDLFWLNGPNFQLYASNGKVLPITSEIAAGAIDPANYPSSVVGIYNLDGVQYGVPKDFDTIGLWYNKAIFEKAGVAVPTNDWTWADLSKAANAISSTLSSQGLYGVGGDMTAQVTYYNTIFQAGGNVISADGTKSGYSDKATQAGLQFWTDLIASGASPSMQQLSDTAAEKWFTSGKLAMFYGGSWSRTSIANSEVAGDVNVVALPAGEQEATVIHGVANVVAAKSKNIAAAQALQVYLASKEAQQQQGDLGAVIPAFNGTQQAFANSYPGVDLQIFLDQTAVAKPLPISKDTSAWNALEAALLPDAFSGTKPVAEVADDLANQMDAALAK